jgi:hypothetical protein
MDWLPVVATVIGAVTALGATLVADIRRDRSQRTRDRALDRWQTYVDFAMALDAAHAALREVARTASAPDRRAAAGQAIHESGVYRVRERVLMSASGDLVRAGEAVFLRLIEIRDAVRKGAMVSTPAFHDVYHPFAEALWTFRAAVRTELGEKEITPAALGRPSWSEREDCDLCGRSGP